MSEKRDAEHPFKENLILLLDHLGFRQFIVQSLTVFAQTENPVHKREQWNKINCRQNEHDTAQSKGTHE